MIRIDLRTDLPKVRAAYNAGQLQAQNVDRSDPFKPHPCTYPGPCAIGVMVTPEERLEMDRLGNEVWDDTGISAIARPTTQWIDPDPYDDEAPRQAVNHDPLVAFGEPDQLQDAQSLQSVHDAWVNATPGTVADRRQAFEIALTELEVKYGHADA